MSLRDLLQRRQAHAVPPAPRSPGPQGTEKPLENQEGYPGSPGSLANATGTVEQPVSVAANDPEPPGPASGIDLLLAHLRFDFTGAPLHHIDNELAGMIRLAMLPMGQRARAELAALIDDHLCRRDGRGRVLALLEERIETQGPTTWFDWIKVECPLVDGDIEFVEVKLVGLSLREQEQAARRYVAAWQAAADAEPLPYCKANAGRRAANQTLLPARKRSMATATTRQVMTITPPPRLPEGVRMAWTIRVGDKSLVLAGSAYTRNQAQQAAEARWLDAVVADAASTTKGGRV